MQARVLNRRRTGFSFVRLSMLLSSALILALCAGCGGGGGTSASGPIPPPPPGTLPYTRVLTGLVRDAVTKGRLADVKVAALDSSATTVVRTARSDASGRYFLGDLPDGSYVIRMGEGSATHKSVDVPFRVGSRVEFLSATLVPNAEKAPTSITVVFPPPTMLVGQTGEFTAITMGGSRPMSAFWTVEPASPGGTIVGRITAEGLFIAERSGTGYVRAHLGAAWASAMVQVNANPSAGVLFGVVVAATGYPVSGATVQAGGRTVDGGIDGTYVFSEAAPGGSTVAATAGALTGSAPVTVTAGSATVALVTAK